MSHDFKSDQSDDNWDDWQGQEGEGSDVEVKCLFCEHVAVGVGVCLEHMHKQHGLDIIELVNRYELDFYDTIKMINSYRASGKLTHVFSVDEIKSMDNSLLSPVLENDPLIHYDYESFRCKPEECSKPNEFDTTELLNQFKNENEQLRAQLDHCKLLLSQVIKEDKIEELLLHSVKKDDGLNGKLHISDEQGYIDSYSDTAIHEEMLRDVVRTKAYESFIYKNKHLFVDKVIMDVGCGTGILSMMAAKAGARRVYGVEFSEVAHLAKKNICENKLESTITILHKKLEDVNLTTDLNGEKVDLVISEWMGYFLFFESMLNTVLYARDNFLANVKHVYPNKATLYIAAAHIESLDYWDDVYGFQMTSIRDKIKKECNVSSVSAQSLVSNTYTLSRFDMTTMSETDTAFSSDFIVRLDTAKSNKYNAFVIWFDNEFSGSSAGCANESTVLLSTGPNDPQTHWKQSILYIKENKEVTEENKLIIGTLTVKPSVLNPRGLEIQLSYKHSDANSLTKLEYFMI